MKDRAFVSLTCGVLALCAASPSWAYRDGALRTPYAEYSVGYASPAELGNALSGRGGTVVERVPSLRIARVRLPQNTAARVARLRGIRFVQRVAKRRDAAEPGLQAPVGKTTAWEWQFAAADEENVPTSVLRAASSVTIAVIDTGADLSAPDIAAKNPITFSPRAGTTDVRDSMGHGTFVAALAAGSVTNGEGIAGFGGDAKLMIVKAGVGDGTLTDVDEASAITYAVDHGARIINLSFGGTQTSTTERSAIDYASAHGVLVVAAAGNDYLAGNPVLYPAALLQPLGSNGVGGIGLSVGAATEAGARAPFSDTGSYISLAAPGENVFSAVSSTSPVTAYPRVPLPGSLNGLYGYGSGTSFATPEVAGAAALVMAANPLLGAADVARVLKESASGRGTWTPELGYGVIDVAGAVALATGTQPQTAHAILKLRAHLAKRKVRLTATLSSLARLVSAAGRSVVFERYTKYGAWKRIATATTDAGGLASVSLREGTAPLRLRASWNGAIDLAAVSSGPVPSSRCRRRAHPVKQPHGRPRRRRNHGDPRRGLDRHALVVRLALTRP